MKKYLLTAIASFFLLTVFSQEYRIYMKYNGVGGLGMRIFSVSVDKYHSGTWKPHAKADIATGRNLQMAEIKDDTMYIYNGLTKLKDLYTDTLFYKLFEKTVNSYLDRTDSVDKENMNLVENPTSNEVTYDATQKLLTISLRAGKGETGAYIFVTAKDNSQAMVYEKTLKTFAMNYLDLSLKYLTPGTYIVRIVTPLVKFSKEITVN